TVGNSHASLAPRWYHPCAPPSDRRKTPPGGYQMDTAEPTALLVRRLSDGDPRAAAALFARYSRQLVRLAERHLSRRAATRARRAAAPRADGDEVVQRVSRPFSRRGARGQFRIDPAGETWRLLVAITLRKARTQARRQTAGLRDVAAEAAGGFALEEALAREPG